jgi:hypothetical protein
LEVEMKSIAKIICCGVALAWMVSAAAAEEAAGAAVPDDVVVPTPPAPRITVKPYHDKVDRAKVERRLDDKSARTRKRAAAAEKDAAERAARQQQANPAPAGQ